MSKDKNKFLIKSKFKLDEEVWFFIGEKLFKKPIKRIDFYVEGSWSSLHLVGSGISFEYYFEDIEIGIQEKDCFK